MFKSSREITTKSKRVIFALHRSAEMDRTKVSQKLTDTMLLFSELKRSFQEISVELQDGRYFWRYHKTLSPGLQEYIEALSFARYLKDQTLLSFKDLQQDLKSVSVF